MKTINDVYQQFCDLHGSTTPVRSRDELHTMIFERKINIQDDDQLDALWDEIFDDRTGWAWGIKEY